MENFCEQWCDLEKNNNGRTPWIIQRNKKLLLFRNEQKNNDLSKLNKTLVFLLTKKFFRKIFKQIFRNTIDFLFTELLIL